MIIVTRISVMLPLVLASLAASVAYAGNVYKWTDDRGQVHYGERQPGEYSTKELRLNTSPSPSRGHQDEHLQQRKRLLESYDKKRQVKREQAIKQQAQDEERQASCEEAQRNVSFFERAEGSRLARPGTEGEVEWIDDDERASIRAYWREQVELHCD